MRTIRLFFAIALLILGGTFAQAQPGPVARGMTPEQRADQQTALMTEKLSLSAAQADKVKQVNLKYAKKIQDARESSNGDWEAMRSAMTTIRTEQDAELKTMLTEEQWQQWTQYREEMRGNRGNWEKGNPPSGDRPPAPSDDTSPKPKKEKNKNKNKDSDTLNKQ